MDVRSIYSTFIVVALSNLLVLVQQDRQWAVWYSYAKIGRCAYGRRQALGHIVLACKNKQIGIRFDKKQQPNTHSHMLKMVNKPMG